MYYSLTNQQVLDIKSFRAAGYNYFQIGEKFGISFQYAQAICTGKARSNPKSKTLPNESWKVVPFTPVLEASNLGRIRRLETQRVLKQTKSKKNEYYYIGSCYLSKKVTLLVHKLVLEAWVGPCPTGLQINHINGKKNDNRVENLEYVTPSENSKHAYRIGLKSAEGEKNGRSRLTEEQVLEIRRLAEETDMTSREIGLEFDISQSHCSHIINRTFWSHI